MYKRPWPTVLVSDGPGWPCTIQKVNSEATATEKLVLQMRMARKRTHFYLACLFCEIVSSTVAPSFIYPTIRWLYFILVHSFSFSIRDVACCSVSNQIFAHLTDNRATGSNNNNHFAQVQCIRQKWLFTRRSSERVFFFFFFFGPSHSGFSTENVGGIAVEWNFVATFIWPFAFCCFLSVLFIFFSVVLVCWFFGASHFALCRRRRRYISIYDANAETTKTIFGRTIFVVELNK